MQCAPLPTPTQEKRPARSTGASATGGGKTRTSTSSAPRRPSCCSAPPPSTVSVWPPWPEFGRTEMTTPTIENTVRPGAEATDEEFRLRMRAFLADNAPGKRPRDPAGKVPWTKSWHATLFDNGYAGPSWPVEPGGMAPCFARQVIYPEEIARAKVPGPPGTGLGILAPTILTS